MGNMCSFTGSRRSNRVLPTNSTVLALGLGNRDLALYRRHKKKDDAELGLPVVSGSSSKADTKQLAKGESSKEGNLQDYTNSEEPDKEMQEWLCSIILQNHLQPRFMTFDSKRHLSMRSKYTDASQMINLCNVIHETQEEHQTNSLAPSGKIKGRKKNGKQGIKKILSHETFNLGLGPSPKLSTRISKDAVKKNRQKDNQLRFHGRKSPPPPKPMVYGSSRSKAGILKNSESKDPGESQKTANSGKHFHVSSNWLDEDFEESILSYPKEIPKTIDIPQCPRLSPKPAQEDRGKKSIKFKIEPEISEPAVHNLGLFLSAVEEDQSDPKSRSRFLNVFKKKHRISATYTAEDLPLCDDPDDS